jgi:hypothetical protein
VIVQGTKEVEWQAGRRDFGMKSDQGTCYKMKVSLVFRRDDFKSLYRDKSGKGRVERRIYAVNCSVRMKIYLKGK